MILKQADFDFKVMKNKGDSGNLLIATQKADGKKFIVKHQRADNACNEFMYFAIAKELGLPTLEFYLFEKDETKKRFKSKYAIAIEYLEDAKKFDYDIETRDQVKNWQDSFKHWALFAALTEHDGFEILQDKDGHIYRIDPTDAFCFSYFVEKIDKPEILEFLTNLAMNYHKQVYGELTQHFKKLSSENGKAEQKLFLDTLKKLTELADDKIDPYLDELEQVYPQDFTHCYVFFIESCKLACREFLSELDY